MAEITLVHPEAEQVRIGRVEGPFRVTRVWSDGSKKTSAQIRAAERRLGKKYWTVRWLDGSILRDAHFRSEAAAKEFFGSMRDPKPGELI